MGTLLSLGALWQDLAEGKPDPGADAVREWITGLRGYTEKALVASNGKPAFLTADEFMRQRPKPWNNIPATLAEGRNTGTMRLACSLRARTDMDLADALALMTEKVWPFAEQTKRAGDFSYEEFAHTIQGVWRQYPSGAEELQEDISEAQRSAERMTTDPPVAYTIPALGDAAPVTEYKLPAGVTHELPAGTMEFKDAYLVDRIVKYVLHRRFLWARGLQWMTWNGRVWESVDRSVVIDAVRMYFVWLHGQMGMHPDPDLEILKGVTGLLSKAKIEAAVQLCQGHAGSHVRDAAAFDAYPDLINTPEGIVDLRSGNIMEHNPDLLFTKMTKGCYHEGLKHPDWEKALTALDEPERSWFQARIGQAITGHIPSDGIMPVLQGSGENGKTALTTDGPVRALGDYADMASHKLITSVTPGRTEHSTEMADLRGQRLLIGEELAEGRSIDVTALKRIMDVGTIKARLVHKDNMTFQATHSLFVTTNYMPLINESDHGTWRRLALLQFPYSFKKAGEPLETPFDREGDPGLKARIKGNVTGQWDAIVTWAVEGAMRWYERGMTDLAPTKKIQDDTWGWRKQSDAILGWLSEHMQFTKDWEPAEGGPYCVLTTEAYEDLSDWLRERGHQPWAMKLFLSRLAGHEESRKNALGQARTRALRNLSRRPLKPGMVQNPLPKDKAGVLTGLVFQTEEVGKESSKNGGWAGWAGTQQTPHRDPSCENFSNVPAHPAQGAACTPDVAHNGPEAEGCSGTTQSDEDPSSATSPVHPDRQTPLKPEKPGYPPKCEKPKPEPKPKTAKQAEAAQKRAIEREEARQEKILELGGSSVALPAIVLRDQTLIECDVSAAAAFLEPYRAGLSVDVEHAGYPLGHENYRLRLVQLGGEAGAVVLDPADEAQADVIRHFLASAAKLHAHNAGADLIPLEAAGLCDASAWDRMDDTVILAKLTDPKLTDSDESGLKPLAKNLLGADCALSWKRDKERAALFRAGGWVTETEVTTPLNKSGWANVPVCETFVRYAASDVMDCSAVARKLGPGIPDWLMERERTFAKAWRPIALKGTPLDHAHIRELIREHETAQEAARERVCIASGNAIDNPKSNIQVAPYLESAGYVLPRSEKTGKPGAPKGVLEPLAARGDELCQDILEYRRHDTALGLLLRPWNEMCEHGDGRIRSSIMSIEARTGRTSSRDFNMQQVSRQGGMRACVTTEKPGETCGISADFNSVEVRVGAALSGDQNMQYLIRMLDQYPDKKREYDFHWRTAITCYGEAATKENRYSAKRVNFAKMYGSGKQSCANEVGITVQEVSRAFDAFSQVAPQYEAWDREMRARVRAGERGYPTYSGRVAWFDPRAEHGAGNTAIQATARELAVDATLRWLQGDWGYATLLIVHDELIAFDIPRDEAQAATDFLVACMQTEIAGVAIKAEPNEPWEAWPDAS